MRPWDPSNDLLQYESEFIVQTWTRHKTPVVRTCSITSLEQKQETKVYPTKVRKTNHKCIAHVPVTKCISLNGEESESSTPELDTRQDSDSSAETSMRMYYALLPIILVVLRLLDSICGCLI